MDHHLDDVRNTLWYWKLLTTPLGLRHQFNNREPEAQKYPKLFATLSGLTSRFVNQKPETLRCPKLLATLPDLTNRFVNRKPETLKCRKLPIVFVLLAASYSGDDDSTAPTIIRSDLDDSIGLVKVELGESIQIRSLNAISGGVAQFGLPISRAAEFAVEHYGDIKGFSVDLGVSLDDLCSADGGQAAAQTIVSDPRVVAVNGTSCSGAATSAAPLITDAGITMISGGNTSPSLTSDLADTPGENHDAMTLMLDAIFVASHVDGMAA